MKARGGQVPEKVADEGKRPFILHHGVGRRPVRRWRRWRFLRAYLVLRNEAERHRIAGHEVEFTAVNESHMVLICDKCPELQP